MRRGPPKVNILSAQHCGVSEFMVRKYREDVTTIESKSPLRTGLDGRTINVANIGRTNGRTPATPTYDPRAFFRWRYALNWHRVEQ
jgi:hypothetical protein